MASGQRGCDRLKTYSYKFTVDGELRTKCEEKLDRINEEWLRQAQIDTAVEKQLRQYAKWRATNGRN